MRYRKEEKILLNSEKVLKELNSIYNEGIVVIEYTKLIEEYRKLYKKYEKTIKVSDSIGNTIMKKNDSLNNNLEYTIKKARHNLFKNIEEHKRTKDALLNYKEKANQFELSFNELVLEKKKVKKILDNYVSQFGEIKHAFINEINEETFLTSFENISLEKVLTLSFSKVDHKYLLLKVELKEFNKIIETINRTTVIKNFIGKIYKFIENSVSNDSTIYHQKEGVFYIVLSDKGIKEVSIIEKKLKSKRAIYNLKIDFDMCATEYLEIDSIENIIKRCDIGLNEAKAKNKLIFV